MRKVIKTLLSVLFAMFIVAPALAYPDVDSKHWASKQIKDLTEKGVIIGYPDGTFKPDENVTRAEFASMAIRALGQENAQVVQSVEFSDITPSFWAYKAIQKSLYFDLISSNKGEAFRPDDSVSRAESITVAVNALTTEDISEMKAKEVLSRKFADYKSVPESFVIPAGKAEILHMLVTMPSENTAKIEANRPATRAEVTAILYEMIAQAKLNPNAKLAEAMRKKTGEGYVIDNATVQGSFGIIPAGTFLPIEITTYVSSQTSENGEIYVAKAEQNYITKDKYILVYKGANLKGQLLDIRDGKWFVRNGVVVLDNSLITTNNYQTANLSGMISVSKDRNWFMKFVRYVFKGEKLFIIPCETVYLKLLKPLTIDLTNGWIIE